MLETKLSFPTACHPPRDGLAERMIQELEDIICGFWKSVGKVRLTEEFSVKHPVFPVFFQTLPSERGDKFPSSNKRHTLREIVEVEESPGPVEKIMKVRNIRLNGKDHRQYLVRFKNQAADKDKGLEGDAIPDGNLHLRRFRASRRAEKSHE
ncbi:hypothetical protein O181_013661 [Austropuccinia psidii MF-1]|uniref:Uncharacterized protein n=1 Tax=Austropuccinia psidii MF-1 TaxID=1389203 RepID=A0A9Q3C071_9BASI|nr:hypothetical protein [Austropuccinia psidii MF-1]